MKRIVVLTLLIGIAICSFAQSLSVKSFVLADNDLSARTNKVEDVNKDACALVKVRLALPEAQFKGQVVNIVPKMSEYWVYMTAGSKRLTVVVPGYLPNDVDFSKYEISRIEGLKTYVLTLEIPFVPGTTNNKMQRVKFNVTPNDATLIVDNLDFSLTDGFCEVPLSVGKHTYRISREYYQEESSSIVLDGISENKEISINLKLAQSNVSVISLPEGADVILEGKSVGKTPLTHTFIAGKHEITIQKKGYKSIIEHIDVKDSNPISIERKLSTLIDATIKSVPQMAMLTFNGVQMGHTPRPIKEEAGMYHVSLRAKGYYDYEGTITLDGSNSEYIIKMKPQYFKNSGGYVDIGARYAGNVYVGASVGDYINRFNVEAGYYMGLSESESIYWTSPSMTSKPVAYTYKPSMVVPVRFGYGLMLGDRCRMTPQLGATFMKLTETAASSSQSKAEGAYCLVGSFGLRTEFAVAKHFAISCVPEYGISVSESAGFEALSNVSNDIKGLKEGFAVKACISILF